MVHWIPFSTATTTFICIAHWIIWILWLFISQHFFVYILDNIVYVHNSTIFVCSCIPNSEFCPFLVMKNAERIKLPCDSGASNQLVNKYLVLLNSVLRKSALLTLRQNANLRVCFFWVTGVSLFQYQAAGPQLPVTAQVYQKTLSKQQVANFRRTSIFLC